MEFLRGRPAVAGRAEGQLITLISRSEVRSLSLAPSIPPRQGPSPVDFLPLRRYPFGIKRRG